MQETIAKESPRRLIGRRLGAAGVALAAVVTLGACNGTGGGYVGTPLDGGPVTYRLQVQSGLRLQLHLRNEHNGQQAAVIKGEITYHDSPPSLIDEVRVPGDPAPRHSRAHRDL